MKQAPRSRQSEGTKRRRRNHELRKRYCTARWAALRRRVLSRDHGLCQQCHREGRVETGNQVDHIQPADEHPELFWVIANLETLCRGCHLKKTMRGE